MKYRKLARPVPLPMPVVIAIPTTAPHEALALLPNTPCPDCQQTRWARFPLIGGRAFKCLVCEPIGKWSPLSESDLHASAWIQKEVAA